MERLTVWAEPLNHGDFEPYYVCAAGIETLRAYPEYLSFQVGTMIQKIVDKIGSTPCILQARMEYWTLMANGGYDYQLSMAVDHRKE